MKQVTRQIKLGDAETAATFLYENGITVILSWLEEDFFDKKIKLVLALKENLLPLLNTQEYFRAA